MLESAVESRLKKLEAYGFEVLKLRTPGYGGTPDRLILRPKYSPGAPSVVEIKKPGKYPRALQEAVANDWRTRGVTVHEYCDTYEKIDELVGKLKAMVDADRRKALDLPPFPVGYKFF